MDVIRTSQSIALRCVKCARVSKFGNCAEPVAAGLAERFMLVRHPSAGTGCAAFAAQVAPEVQKLHLRADRLCGTFYDDSDFKVLSELIDRGDDLARLERLIADAESRIPPPERATP